jgi:hypothetical protein
MVFQEIVDRIRSLSRAEQDIPVELIDRQRQQQRGEG